ncbi:hypothetical protein ACIRPH_17605 [Nocardiopsis sp. NPDC101807]|uniref:hypothetical protein n=1 Tax=Nocardiopsis sp. NPDC101807 TaxID=3364339 RepID=UPI00381E055B
MPLNAASSPPSHGRRRTGVVLGAVFVGSGLVAVMSPAYADQTASESPSPAPVPSAVVAFENSASEVETGRPAPPNAVTAVNTGGLAVCLLDLVVRGEDFTSSGFVRQEVAPGAEAPAGVVTGSPRESTDVVATLTYALAEEDADCSSLEPSATRTVSTGTWSVSVVKPDPSPPPTGGPTETPTDPPTETPTEEPTRTPSDPPSSSDPAPTRSPGDGGRDRDRDRASDSPTARPGTPRGGVGDVPTTGAEIPTLPRNDADLPEVAPGSEDLAELPLVSPSSDDDLDGTEVAADHGDMGPNMAPAVLLAALLLALLLAAPLAPVRRVRIGGGYQGKRRKG